MHFFAFISASFFVMMTVAYSYFRLTIKVAPHPGGDREQVNFVTIMIPAAMLGIFSLISFVSARTYDDKWLLFTLWSLLLVFLIPIFSMLVVMVIGEIFVDRSEAARMVVQCQDCQFVQQVEYAETKCLNCDSQKKLKLYYACSTVSITSPSTWLPRARWRFYGRCSDHVVSTANGFVSRDKFA